MKRSVFRFVLSSLLVVAPFFTASAGVSVMTDEDLGTVSAKGFETVTPGISAEYNNFNAVQLGGTAQSGSSAMTVYNVVMDNMNIHQNIVDLESVTHFSPIQTRPRARRIVRCRSSSPRQTTPPWATSTITWARWYWAGARSRGPQHSRCSTPGTQQPISPSRSRAWEICHPTSTSARTTPRSARSQARPSRKLQTRCGS